jgi:hypothetical protein
MNQHLVSILKVHGASSLFSEGSLTMAKQSFVQSINLQQSYFNNSRNSYFLASTGNPATLAKLVQTQVP